MKRIVRLTEIDLNRIVRNVLSEGLIQPSHTFKSDTAGYEIKVNCTKGENDTGSITGGRKGGEIRIGGDMYSFFC